MLRLSHATQVEIEHAKKAIAEFKDALEILRVLKSRLDGYLYRRAYGKLIRALRDGEELLRNILERHLGRSDASSFKKRIKLTKLSWRLRKQGLRIPIERNLATAQDAFAEGIRYFERRIEELKTGALSPKVIERENAEPTTPKNPILILRPTVWGMGIDLHEIWKRLRKR